jgi:outer membrane protein insertion porin family
MIAPIALVLSLVLLKPQAPQAPQPASNTRIERVDIRNNRRVRSDTIKYNLQTKPGDDLNPAVVARDIKTLYAMGYFDDIRVETEASEGGGLIVYFFVTERLLISAVDFNGLTSLTKSDILDKLRERKMSLGQESPFDESRVKQVEGVIRAMLSEKGHSDAEIEYTTEDVPPNHVRLAFGIHEGPAVKIERISIEGNHVFTERQIKKAMKLVKETGPLTVFGSKDTYYDLKLQDDISRIYNLYREYGYIRANVLDPEVETKPKFVYRTLPLIKPPLPFGAPIPGWKKRVNRFYITIKLEENDQYRIGTVKVTGAKEFNPLLIQALLQLVPGQVFNATALTKGFDNLKKLYGSRGYINFSPVPMQDVDEEKKVINLSINIDEERQYSVRRIDFSGNDTTRDKVIRRQLLVDEGQIFNSQLWDFSVLKLNQLGFFEEVKPEDADIRPLPNDSKLDINLKLKEKSRNSVGFNGGVSGIGGSFIGLSYETNNFLGLGESLGLTLQGGTRQSQYQLSFTEPYFIDRPIALGFSVFKTSFRYDQARELFGLDPSKLPTGLGLENRLNFEQSHTGFSLSASYPMRLFHRIGITYQLDNSSTSAVNPATQAYFAAVNIQNRNFVNNGSFTTYHGRRVTPTYTYNTTDNPYNPTRGFSFTGSLEFSGGFLGGDTNLYRPSMEVRYYHRVNHGRNTIAMRSITSYVQSFTNLSTPFYERFFVGGDFDIRGFDFRTLSPISFITRTLPVTDPITLNTVNKQFDDIVYVGGDTQEIFNFEYRIPLVGPITLAPFMDAGNTWVTRSRDLTREVFDSSGTRKIPADFLPGTNSGLRMSTGVEFQVVMPVINAPFRLVFALNPARIDRSFVGPVTGLPFAIHQPGHDFKFTVGRTF